MELSKGQYPYKIGLVDTDICSELPSKFHEEEEGKGGLELCPAHHMKSQSTFPSAQQVSYEGSREL